jgi:hypothetical protein
MNPVTENWQGLPLPRFIVSERRGSEYVRRGAFWTENEAAAFIGSQARNIFGTMSIDDMAVYE